MATIAVLVNAFLLVMLLEALFSKSWTREKTYAVIFILLGDALFALRLTAGT